MTNRTRLVSLLGFRADKDSIDGALIDAGIDGTLTYDKTQSTVLRNCAIELLELLLSTPDQTNENGFVIKYDRGAIQARIRSLQTEEIETGAVLRSKSIW